MDQLCTADLPERAVNVFGATVRRYALPAQNQQFPSVEIDIISGSGFYVRSFARYLGSILGPGGTLKALHRLHNGGFDQCDIGHVEDTTANTLRLFNSLAAPDYPFRFYPQYMHLLVYVFKHVNI